MRRSFGCNLFDFCSDDGKAAGKLKESLGKEDSYLLCCLQFFVSLKQLAVVWLSTIDVFIHRMFALFVVF